MVNAIFLAVAIVTGSVCGTSVDKDRTNIFAAMCDPTNEFYDWDIEIITRPPANNDGVLSSVKFECAEPDFDLDSGDWIKITLKFEYSYRDSNCELQEHSVTEDKVWILSETGSNKFYGQCNQFLLGTPDINETWLLTAKLYKSFDCGQTWFHMSEYDDELQGMGGDP